MTNIIILSIDDDACGLLRRHRSDVFRLHLLRSILDLRGSSASSGGSSRAFLRVCILDILILCILQQLSAVIYSYQ